MYRPAYDPKLRDTRWRMLDETGRYLTHCMANPHLAPVIPTMRVEQSESRRRFHPALALCFWRRVLT